MRNVQFEERLKVEKQGARERVESFKETIKDLEAQVHAQTRRNTQLQELLDLQKASLDANNETKAITAKNESTFQLLNEQLREQLEENRRILNNERQRLKTLEEE